MKFKIERTSRYALEQHDPPPCSGAVWEDGQFVIEVETIEKLVALSTKELCPVILTSPDKLELYDDYRE